MTDNNKEKTVTAEEIKARTTPVPKAQQTNDGAAKEFKLVLSILIVLALAALILL